MARAAVAAAVSPPSCRSLTALLGAAACLVSTGAAASPLRFEVAEGTRLASYTSTERRENGALFDRESGLLTGFSLAPAASRGPWRLELGAALAVGTIDYEGQTQLGLPLASRTRLRHTQLAVSPSYRIGTTPLFVGASLQSRRIDRRIEATPISQGLHETLNQVQVGPLLGARWDSSFGLGVLFLAEVLWTFHSTLDVDFEGAYDNGHLTLSSNGAESATLEVSYAVFRHVAIAADAVGEVFRPARSTTVPLTDNGVQAGTYDYPGSLQEQWSVSLGIRTRF